MQNVICELLENMKNLNVPLEIRKLHKQKYCINIQCSNVKYYKIIKYYKKYSINMFDI